MPSRINDWEFARSPNYVHNGNVDKLYPYSEVPYIGKYKLVKIPQSNLIDLVNYWGEGRIDAQGSISGFPDCYNVNHPYQCVSNGPDVGRKIPNRVPVQSYTTCDTSYIKDDSVRTVTLMGAPINNSCAKDIARMVSRAYGKVILFGFHKSLADVKNVEQELNAFNFIYCPYYELPRQLKGLTLFDDIDCSSMKGQLHSHITNGDFGKAISDCKALSMSSCSNIISDVVNQLLEENLGGNRNLPSLAYKLWITDGQDVVIKHFPKAFKAILSGDFVTIVNKKNSLALKFGAALDSDNDKIAWGDASDKTSSRVLWKFIPEWRINNRVAFKILNMDTGMFLKLAAYTDSVNDREAWGSYGCGDDRHVWKLDPLMVGSELLFFVVNLEYLLGLKLAGNVDEFGDRRLWGHSADVHGDPDHFGWYINPV